MVSKFVWIIGVGLPIYLMLYFGLAGLYYIPYNEQYFTYRPNVEISFFFLVFGFVGTFAMAMRYFIGGRLHGRHCELTYYSFYTSATALAIAVIAMSILKNNPPFALPVDWYWLFGLPTLAGFVGIILYRLERGKSLLPRLK